MLFLSLSLSSPKSEKKKRKKKLTSVGVGNVCVCVGGNRVGPRVGILMLGYSQSVSQLFSLAVK